jgi:two-component system chemotaxis response regulator CheB
LLSSHTSEGAEVTLRGLDLGAMDFVDKSSVQGHMNLSGLADELLAKVRVLASIPRERLAKAASPARAAVLPARHERPADVVVIGTSTGGPSALQAVIPRLPRGLATAILVVQHMPAGFTGPFAERLSRLSQLQVSEAVEGDRLRSGRVLVAPAGRHLRITSRLTVALEPEPADAKHIPSVDVTMTSADRARPGRVLGILLTGMGQDGAEGMATIRASGGFTIGESEATCVVYGMPRAAEMRGAVECMLPLPEIVSFLERLGSLSD